jgi:protein-tyrosine phosphatase
VIDLHCHLIPGVDDGPASMNESIALAERLVAEGVETVVATPHVSPDYPTSAEMMVAGVADVRAALAAAAVPLSVEHGAEISFAILSGLGRDELRRLTLGGGDVLLLESPYNAAAPFLEEAIFDVQVMGFRTMLAHPERSPVFQEQPDRVATLVERGALCCVNGGSLGGRFGERVRTTAVELFRRGLVHAVASDAHDLRGRPPLLRAVFAGLEGDLPGIGPQVGWYTRKVPAALLAGEPLPPRPATPSPPRRLRGLIARLRR